jgi:hypothetical protein
MPTLVTALVDTQTNEFLDSGRAEDARYVRKTVSRNPDPAREKWDAVLEFRLKTAAELTADAAARLAQAQLGAQLDVDAFPVATKAIVLALIDQLNVIRAGLPTPLGAITPAQAIAAIRTKAGLL